MTADTTPGTRTCAAKGCSHSLDGCKHDGRRKAGQARYCSDTCRERDKKSRRSTRRRFAGYVQRLGVLPPPGSSPLSSHLENETLDVEINEYVKPGGYPVPGGVPDIAEPGHDAYKDALVLNEAIRMLDEHYRELAAPYLAQLARNRGVRPKELAAIEQERWDKIAELESRFEKARALDRAARAEPGRLVKAQQAAQGVQNMAGFAQDRYGSRSGPVYGPSRETRAIWNWRR